MNWKKLLLSTTALISLGTVTELVVSSQQAEATEVQSTEQNQAQKAGFTASQFKAIKALDEQDIDYTTNKEVVNRLRASLSDKQQAVVSEAQKQVGVKFTWGGRNPQSGFDCAGLVQYVFKTAANVSLGNTVSSQATAGTSVSKNNLQPGDIVFFDNNSYNGIYIGNNNVIATIGTDKVGIANIQYLGTFSSARRVLTADTHTVSKATELKGTYVTITAKNTTLWNNKDLTEKRGNTSDYYQQTVQAQRYYTIDGVKYYSIYNKDNKWLGYVSEKAVSKAKNQGGIYLDDGRYATVIKDNYTLWKDLNFDEKKGTTANLKDQMVYVKGHYNHFNGSVYASLYNKDDKWLGYVNQNALSYADSGFWEYQSYNKYVTITKKGYNIYRDKKLSKVGNTSDKLYQNTYLAKGYYDTFNGDRYLTLYDYDGNWVGYVNEKATTLGNNDGSDMGGAWLSVKQNGTVISRDYVMWSSFNFDNVKGNTATLKNKTVWVAGKYHCADGSWYYTVYDQQGGKWLGYVSADAVKLS